MAKPKDLTTALAEIDRLASERRRLAEREGELSSKMAAAKQQLEAEQQAATRAAAETLLSSDDKHGLDKRAAAQQQRAASVAAELSAIEAAIQLLPTKLLERDAEMVAAHQLASDAIEGALAEAVSSQMAILTAAFRAATPALLALHALAQAGVGGGLSRQLGEMSFLIEAPGGSIRLASNALRIGDEVRALAEDWRSDPAAKALFEHVVKITRASKIVDAAKSRLASKAQFDRQAEIDRAGSDWAKRPAAVLGGERAKGAEEYTPPKPTFVPHSYSVRQPGTEIEASAGGRINDLP